MKVNDKVKQYIEENIFPRYKNNDTAHDINHIKNVINRSLELAKNYDVDITMIYTIAAFHDLGHHIDKKNHEKISAEIFMSDDKIKSFFNLEQIKIIEEAIQDHRASLKGTPRSIYGKIVADADRSIDIKINMFRGYHYSLNHNPTYTIHEHIENCYNHANNKFGENGYIRFWLNDKKNINALKKYRKLLKDKNEYIKMFKQVNDIKE